MEGNKNGHQENNFLMSGKVALTGEISNQFLEDLRNLYDLQCRRQI